MIVSAILKPTKGDPTWPLAQYVEWYKRMVMLLQPSKMVLFLDRSLSVSDLPPCVKVIPYSIEELPLWKAYGPEGGQLPTDRNHKKDTQEYFILMNSKTDLCMRALDGQVKATHTVTWVDAGIARIFNKPDPFYRLFSIDSFPNTPDGLWIPGPWREKCLFVRDWVQWRFGGGFFTADIRSLTEFHEESTRAVRSIPGFTWEVNVWNYLENRGFPINWVYGDHNDSFWMNVPC